MIILPFCISDGLNLLSLVNLFTVLFYGIILFYTSQKEDSYYTNRNLFFTVFSISIFFLIILYSLSWFYNQDIMVFCYSDASYYLSTVEKMHQEDFFHSLRHIARWPSEDWGAPVSMLLFYNMIPSKAFINFFYIILGSISSVSLFQIGRRIMSLKHAYISSLIFSISSYWIFYHSSCLKESVMVFIVIESFYFFYKYLDDKKLYNIIIAIITSLLLIFFRPAIIVFLWGGCSIYLMLNSNNKLIWITSLFLVSFTLYFSASYIKDIFDHYTHEGDVETISTYIGATQFNIWTNRVASLIGPFPNLVANTDDISYKHIYGPGLLLKYMLFVPFWYAIYYSIKHKFWYILPIAFFAIFEMFSLYYINNGLVVRKALPHMPFFTIVALWMISLCDDNETFINHRFLTVSKISWIIVLISTFIWNVFK